MKLSKLTSWTMAAMAMRSDLKSHCFNGHGTFTGPCANMVINGGAIIGDGKTPTKFSGKTVVNGSFKTFLASFEECEIYGEALIKSSDFEGFVKVFGSFHSEEGNFKKGLEVMSPKIILRKTHIQGGLIVDPLAWGWFHKSAHVFLEDNSYVDFITFEGGHSGKVILDATSSVKEVKNGNIKHT